MAVRSFVVRRAAAPLIAAAGRWAASSSTSPLAYRSPSSCILGPFASRLLPFSTSIPSLQTSNFQQTACGLSPVPQLDGLPSDHMEVDHDLKAMYLRRKTEDEIIHIFVKTHREYDDCETEFLCIYDESKFHDDFDLNASGSDDDDSDEMVNKMDSKSNEEYEESDQVYCSDDDDDDDDDDDGDDDGEMKNEEESESDDEFVNSLIRDCTNSDFLERYFDDDGEEMVDGLEVDTVPPLTLFVKILYGDNFGQCMQFLARAYPDNHDELTIVAVSWRKSKRSGQLVGLNHLDEFEGFFKERGMEATNLNCLFKCMDKKKSIGEAL